MDKKYIFYMAKILFITVFLTSCNQSSSISQVNSEKETLNNYGVSSNIENNLNNIDNKKNNELDIFSNTDQISNFIIKNYPSIFYDYTLQMIKSIAFRRELAIEQPLGFENGYVPYDFFLYDLDKDSIYEIVITFTVPETDASYSELFKFIDGSYKRIDKSIGFYTFLESSDNKLISIETSWGNQLRVSYLDLKNLYSKDTFICSRYIDYINEVTDKQYTEEEIISIENLLKENNKEIKEIASEDLKKSIKEKINIKNDNHITWKDMYPYFLFNNVMDDNQFVLYDFDKDDIPELIFSNPISQYNSNIFSYKDGEVVSLNYVIEEDLQNYSIYNYKNKELDKEGIVINYEKDKTESYFIYRENNSWNKVPFSLKSQENMYLLKWYENNPYDAINIMYEQ